ncbi:MAG: amidohydrolase family protein [bacterium]|nr:amidohydrolase family protein [bacterium]
MDRRIIEIHAHAFPDAIAERAMAKLNAEVDEPATGDGTITGLLASMDAVGIEKAVLASIATRPGQFDAIMRWSREAVSDRLIPFPSVYPGESVAADHVRLVAEEGFKGIKLHPYYQDFDADSPEAFRVYAAAADTGLAILLHAGYDPAFDRVRRGGPAQIHRTVEAFPDLQIIAAHMGAWEDWDEAERLLLGKPVLFDVSMAITEVPAERARRWLTEHPSDCLLYGSDWPWQRQEDVLNCLLSLGLDDDLVDAILYRNAARLLGVV